jgi:hypothetical protein
VAEVTVMGMRFAEILRLIDCGAADAAGSSTCKNEGGIKKTADTHTADPANVAPSSEPDPILAVVMSGGSPAGDRISSLAGTRNELDAIASVVRGSRLLTSGVGMVSGTLFSGMIQGLIATLINLQWLAQLRLNLDHQRRAAVPVHCHAAFARRLS